MTKDVVTVNAEDGLCKVQRIMDRYNIGCLPVVDNSKVIGILTSKDIRSSHPNRIAADAMTKKLISVTPDVSVWKAKQKMDKHKIERLLVLEEGRLVGIVTQTQLYYELGKYTDLLTDLYKGEYIYHKAVELLTNNVEIAFIFVDMDRFGYINKQYGHTSGNMILKEMSAILKRNIPEGAYLCRFGGDEFTVLSQHTPSECRLLAEGIIKAVSAVRFYKDIDVSVSIGIADSRNYQNREGSHIKTVMELINMASLASTKAKKEKLKIVVDDELAVFEIA